MDTIEIDFDVFKKLTSLREHKGDSYNDALRRLLKLPPVNKRSKPDTARYWSCRGGTIRVGTRLRARYKGRTFYAAVTDRGIEHEGKFYGSPSEAAQPITGTNVNGWQFWQCQLPGATGWRPLGAVRRGIRSEGG